MFRAPAGGGGWPAQASLALLGLGVQLTSAAAPAHGQCFIPAEISNPNCAENPAGTICCNERARTDCDGNPISADCVISWGMCVSPSYADNPNACHNSNCQDSSCDYSGYAYSPAGPAGGIASFYGDRRLAPSHSGEGGETILCAVCSPNAVGPGDCTFEALGPGESGQCDGEEGWHPDLVGAWDDDGDYLCDFGSLAQRVPGFELYYDTGLGLWVGVADAGFPSNLDWAWDPGFTLLYGTAQSKVCTDRGETVETLSFPIPGASVALFGSADPAMPTGIQGAAQAAVQRCGKMDSDHFAPNPPFTSGARLSCSNAEYFDLPTSTWVRYAEESNCHCFTREFYDGLPAFAPSISELERRELVAAYVCGSGVEAWGSVGPTGTIDVCDQASAPGYHEP